MPIGSFASKVFQVSSDRIYTFDELQYSSSLQTEKQNVEGTKPSTYNKGPDLDSMNFKLKLDSAFNINPRTEWEEWQSIMNSSVAYPFILGGKPLGSYSWLLTGVDPSDFKIDNDGNILSLNLSLKFEEYVRQGSAKEKNSRSAKVPESLSDDEIGSLLGD